MADLLLFCGDILGGYGFAEKPWFLPHERQRALLDELERRGLCGQVSLRDSRAASDDELATFHERAYVEHVTARCRENDGCLDHGPTPARDHVELAARHVVGAALDATDALLAGRARRAFVPIAGFHHAHKAQARMYCLYNDPAIVLTKLLGALPEDRTIAYVDVDVHQGDGVYEAFEREPRVSLVDLHESWRTLLSFVPTRPLKTPKAGSSLSALRADRGALGTVVPHSPEKPGTEPVSGEEHHRGVGPAEGTKLNVELAPGATDEEYLAIWERAEAFLEAARPAFVVFEAGVDHLGGDAMGHLALTERCVRHVTQRLVALAERHAEGRLLVLGGGSYSADGARRGWGAVVEALVVR